MMKRQIENYIWMEGNAAAVEGEWPNLQRRVYEFLRKHPGSMWGNVYELKRVEPEAVKIGFFTCGYPLRLKFVPESQIGEDREQNELELCIPPIRGVTVSHHWKDESNPDTPCHTEIWAWTESPHEDVTLAEKSIRADAATSEESGSLDLTSIFMEALAEVRSRSDPRATELTTKAFDYLRREIERADFAKESFGKLCAKGCEAEELLWLLASCAEGPAPEPDRVSLIMGSDNRQLTAIEQEFRECAALIDSINSAIVGQIFSAANLPLPYQLPTGLREFAALTEFVAPVRWQTYLTVAKKQLIHYVKQRTRHHNDKWVAELIATATDRDDYDPKTHAEWRRNNRTPKNRLPLPRNESVRVARMARLLVKTIYSACICALLVKLSHREGSAPAEPLTKRH